MDELKTVVGVVGVFFGAVGLVVLLIMVCGVQCGSHYAAIQARAAIDQLREDVACVEGPIGEDVLGQVTEWNQEIRKNQALNETVLGSWTTAELWDELDPMEIPEHARREATAAPLR